MNGDKEMLTELLRKKKEHAAAGDSVDWEAVRIRWTEDLAVLYAEIRGWLASMADEGLLTVDQEDIDCSEEKLGWYKVPILKLRFPGGELVEVRPVARVVFSTRGRVDVTLGVRKFMLFRVDRGRWELVEGLSPIRTLPLTEDVFMSALRGLLDGE